MKSSFLLDHVRQKYVARTSPGNDKMMKKLFSMENVTTETIGLVSMQTDLIEFKVDESMSMH